MHLKLIFLVRFFLKNAKKRNIHRKENKKRQKGNVKSEEEEGTITEMEKEQ